MDYLTYFDLSSEPFSNAPLSRFYYDSRQHSEALQRLQWAASSMKGLAILIGDIGLGKTTLARRMLESLPEDQYEAAMLVIVHGGITANWLLKRIAIQLGVSEPADDKLSILSQLYERLLEIHESGRRAVVLIDEAQMLATRDLMEEFRGLLNIELPEHKLISFVFFGLPDIERNLRLDPPLAQRIALRYRLRPLDRDETAAYIEHRLTLAGGDPDLFSAEAVTVVHEKTRGVPRLVNTLCDNLLLEMFFARQSTAEARLVHAVADGLGLLEPQAGGRAAEVDGPLEAVPIDDMLAVDGGPGHDAIVAVRRGSGYPPELEPDAIAAQVALEPVEQEAARHAPGPGPDPARHGFGEERPLGRAPLDASVPEDEAELPELVPEALFEETAAAPLDAPLPEYAADTATPSAVGSPEGSRMPAGEAIDGYELAGDGYQDSLDIEDPLSFLEPSALKRQNPPGPSPWQDIREGGDIPDSAEELPESVGDDVDLDVELEVRDEGPPLGAGAVAAGGESRVTASGPSGTPVPGETDAAPVEPGAGRKGIDLNEIDALLADLKVNKRK